MSRNRKRVSSAAALAAGLLASITSGQITVYNNFTGPAHDGWDYNWGLGWTIAGVDVPAQYGVEQALGFVPSGTGFVSDIWVAMWYVPIDGQPDVVTLRLTSDDDGLPPEPDDVMEEWTITEFESWSQWNPPIHLTGNGTSLLEEGKSYWLWAIGGDTTWCGWCLSTDDILPHTIRREGEDWLAVGQESASAFRIDVMPEFADCPEDVAPPGGDGFVDVLDLLAVLSAWGQTGDISEDINGDGIVDVLDLIQLLSAWGPCPVGETVAIQLAGNSLPDYPYFEFVRAFNDGSTVELAIDPRDLPGAGAPCDVYITDARTESEWLSNPELVDVRGSPQEVIFDGDTIQGATFTLDNSDLLSSDAGLGLGVGYDLVCDFNRNGVLDGGDRIDGLGDEAGFYVVHDITQLGPLPASSVEYTGGDWLGQRTWYPDEITSMGALPLIVISHGHGMDYRWYDYLQEHLASYGYVVMSHENNTGGGYYGAATTTLSNVDYFLGNLTTIAGGIFVGHIDSSRMVWIGHSRGGEGIAQACDLIIEGAHTPEHFTIDDIRLISAIAPPDVTGPNSNNPHHVNYHLLYGSADGDVWGCAASEHQPFRQLERATGFKSSTMVHGADHNDFNCCGWDNFWGPEQTEIGREEAQRVAKALYLVLIEHYVEGNIPALDFLQRQYESFRPIGVAESTIVVSEYKAGPSAGNFIIDDYQTEESPDVSSSGGAVTFDVSNLTESKMKDGNTTFTWMDSDPMNGMTRAGSNDDARGVVFDWTTDSDRFYEFEIIPSRRDFTEFVYLSFHACQGSRHPETIAEFGDLNFTVTLRDGNGMTSSISTGAYGGGIEETYLREGCGEGAGWMNEFETIRIRLTDFLNNGGSLDLTDVVAVRFEFGASFGSVRGRIGLDDVELTTD